MRPPTPKAILFDLDCTLTDRAATLARYAPVFVERFGRRMARADADEVLARLAEVDDLGYRPRAECWAHLLRALPWRDPPPAARELGTLWREAWPACAVAEPDAAAVLESLARRGCTVGVVTNGPADTQGRKVDSLGIRGALAVVVISGAVGVAKPEPAIFRLACDHLGIGPADAWFVGDHPANDAVGARRAGLTEVWVRHGRNWASAEPAPARQIDRLGGLLDLLP